MSQHNTQEKNRLEQLQSALEAIRDEYEDSYDEWLRFSNDLTSYAKERDIQADFYPPDIHMPIVRYQNTPANDILNNSYYSDITNTHIDVLIEYANNELTG